MCQVSADVAGRVGRAREAGGSGQNLGGEGLVAAVAFPGLLEADRGLLPGQGADGLEQFRLLARADFWAAGDWPNALDSGI